jgi:hypothetical protein
VSEALNALFEVFELHVGTSSSSKLEAVDGKGAPEGEYKDPLLVALATAPSSDDNGRVFFCLSELANIAGEAATLRERLKAGDRKGLAMRVWLECEGHEADGFEEMWSSANFQ